MTNKVFCSLIRKIYLRYILMKQSKGRKRNRLSNAGKRSIQVKVRGDFMITPVKLSTIYDKSEWFYFLLSFQYQFLLIYHWDDKNIALGTLADKEVSIIFKRAKVFTKRLYFDISQAKSRRDQKIWREWVFLWSVKEKISTGNVIQ